MAGKDQARVTLTTRTKAGGKIYPEGLCLVPATLLDDLEEAGVMQESAKEARLSVSSGKSEDLTAEQVAAVKKAVAGLKDGNLNSNGTPKVAAVNSALMAAGQKFVVTAKQIAALPNET